MSGHRTAERGAESVQIAQIPQAPGLRARYRGRLQIPRFNATAVPMDTQPLDNPVWASLTSRHASLAVCNRGAARYPADVAPFVAVGTTDASAHDQLCDLVQAGESVYLVGLAPRLDARWDVQRETTVLQMICRQLPPPRPGPQFHPLLEADRDRMIALTALVFPGFFRPRTLAMGGYIGIFAGETLAAMAGERMATEQYTEISAVCTHPDFTSRGFAAYLVTQLCGQISRRGSTPFLHVSPDNVRARKLYERLGFTVRAELGLWYVTRTGG